MLNTFRTLIFLVEILKLSDRKIVTFLGVPWIFMIFMHPFNVIITIMQNVNIVHV